MAQENGAGLLIDGVYDALANVPENEVAKRPRLVIVGNMPAEHYSHRLALNQTAVEKLAERRISRHVSLGSMVVALYDSSAAPFRINGEQTSSRTFIAFGSSQQDDGLHYGPLVVIDVHKKSLETINDDFRHEISHAGDPDKTPFYHRKYPIPATMALGTLTAATAFGVALSASTIGMTELIARSTPAPELSHLTVIGMAWKQVGGVVVRNAGPIVHRFTPTEIRANRFARNNQGLNPLYTTE